MELFGAVLRTPLAIVGFALAGVFTILFTLVMVVIAIAFVVIIVPLSFLGACMGGTRYGQSPYDRFIAGLQEDVRRWQGTVGEAPDLLISVARWWATGSADAPR